MKQRTTAVHKHVYEKGAPNRFFFRNKPGRVLPAGAITHLQPEPESKTTAASSTPLLSAAGLVVGAVQKQGERVGCGRVRRRVSVALISGSVRLGHQVLLHSPAVIPGTEPGFALERQLCRYAPTAPCKYRASK